MAPTANVAVHEVSQPEANQKWAQRCGAHLFYRNFGWGAHAQRPCRHWPQLLGRNQMATLGAAICKTLCERWNSLSPATKPMQAWRQSLGNLGRESSGHSWTTTHGHLGEIVTISVHRCNDIIFHKVITLVDSRGLLPRRWLLHYCPQTKFAKVMFLHVSLSHSVHGGVSQHALQVWGVSRPTAGGEVSRPTPGGVSRPTPGGVCIPACTEADTPQQPATAAGGTHPTGMHSCWVFCFPVNK